MLAYLEHIDKQLLLLINGWSNPLWDNIMVAITGTYIWIPFYLFLLYLLVRKLKSGFWLPLLFIGLMIVATDQLSVHAFKNVFQRYRPCHNLELDGYLHLVKGKCGGIYGFVSSHAANTFALAGFLSFIFQRKIWIAGLIFWASLVSYSRIYLGVHYPSDVLGGTVLGLALGTAFYFMYRKAVILYESRYHPIK
ncbi:MAG: phosphatase PAP2 family protein [Salinivirgaceae bacterium]